MRRPSRGFTIAFVASWLVICILILSMTMNSTTNVSAVEANGVGVYWDSNFSNRVSSIDWGTLTPGSVKSIVVYVRNEVEEPRYFILSTTNWNPPKASKYLNLGWESTEALRMNPGETLQITLTLSVSRYIEGISNFSFDIVITGSQHLPGDIDGDGDVDFFDLGKMSLIYSGFITGPPELIERADLDGDGDVDFFDLGKMSLIYSGQP